MNINPSEFKLLVVDDVPTNVILLKALLSRQQYNVVTASSGPEALEIIQKDCPDLVLLDVMMPEMSGLEVCKHIRQDLNLNDLPVILLTALNNNEDIVEGFAAGANDFVSKPFNNEVLLMRIRFQLSVVASTRIILKQTEDLSNTISSRDKLYSVIAHDLRSPLGTIRMILNYVTPKVKELSQADDELKDMLETANSISEDAFTLFDNLLKWTKSQVGNINYIPQKVDVVEFVSSAIEIQSDIAKNKNITITTKYPQEKIELIVDIDMMKTVFRNLLSNAIKFCDSGSEIVVQMTDQPDKVTFDVIDQGCGMTQDKIDKIESGRVDFTTAGTKNESGSGLGLMLTREFIIRNGGQLKVTSEVGKGSTFSFDIPKKQ